jgi:hypothetical protein
MRIKITDEDIELSSPGAALFYGLCDLWGIDIRHGSLAHSALVADNTYYCPEFYLPGADVWVEVSDGQDEGLLRPYRETWRSAGVGRLAVLYPDELRVLMTRANPGVVRQQLKTWAR